MTFTQTLLAGYIDWFYYSKPTFTAQTSHPHVETRKMDKNPTELPMSEWLNTAPLAQWQSVGLLLWDSQ